MTTLFDPEAGRYQAGGGKTAATFGERGQGKIYVWEPKTVFAVQVAQATRRPLLLRGPAGSGKSSLAPFVANVLDAPFYSFTVTARSQARDMMWEFDALGRLNDANVAQSDQPARGRVGNLHNYVRPRALWWAFDRESARLRGAPSADDLQVPPAEDPAGDGGGSAVVLIDEIDKADPDVPNNLLEALGSRQFTVTDTGTTITDRQSPLVMITTNGKEDLAKGVVRRKLEAERVYGTTNEERELPRAFLRRCIVLHLQAKTATQLARIAAQHFGDAHAALYDKVAATLEGIRQLALKSNERPPSTAEYLDAIAAAIELDVSDDRWDTLVEVALSKRDGGDGPE